MIESNEQTDSKKDHTSLNNTSMNPNPDYIISIVKSKIASNRNIICFVFFLLSASISIPVTRPLTLWICRQFIGVLRTTIGTTLGVGLGLGLATFVREQLENANRNYHDELMNEKCKGGSVIRESPIGPKKHQYQPNSQTSQNQLHHLPTASSTEDNSYAGLMASAGYAVPKGLLRGQILRNINSEDAAVDGRSAYQFVSDVSKRNSRYSFPTIGESENNFKGKTTFQRMWPTLPSEIHSELGLFIDYIIKDYVTSWYASVDDGLRYENEEEKRKRISKEKLPSELPKGGEEDNREGSAGQHKDQTSPPFNTPSATMILSTKPSRTIPFIEILYSSLCTVLGNLATYAGDNINVTEIVLVKFLDILKANVKVYREIRKCVLEKEKEKNTTTSVPILWSDTIGGMHKRQGSGTNFSKSMPPARVSISGQSTESSEDLNGSNNDNTSGVGAIQPSNVNKEMVRNNVTEQKLSSTNSQANGAHEEENQTSADTHQQPFHKHPRRKSKKLEPVSEIAMIREYLLQGKLHRAITFGMDVPGLLFGDMKGEECPLPTNYTDTDDCREQDKVGQQSYTKEDEILEKRLFGNKHRILFECEADYNRLLAFRLCRVLFPRHDFNSPVGRSLSVEMVASCVLTPIMGCFSPDYINSWILKSLNHNNVPKSAPDDGNNRAKENEKSTECVVNIAKQADSFVKNAASNNSENACAEVSSSNEDSIDEDDKVSSFVEDGDEDVTDVDEEADDTDGSLTDEATSVADEVLNDESSDTDNDVDEITHCASQNDQSCKILLLLATSLVELQSHIDFGVVRLARDNDNGLEGVNWSGKDCCNAVRNLVLVIEAALTHGMLATHRRGGDIINNSLEISVVEDAGVDNAVEMSTASSREMGNLVQESSSYMKDSLMSLLMEITSDLESFEKKVDEEESIADTNVKRETLNKKDEVCDLASMHIPNSSDLSTLRTLIAAWLHTGSLFRTMSVLIRSKKTILQPFYHHDALLNSVHAAGFVKQLKVLHQVDILVDTATVLASPPLDLEQNHISNTDDEEQHAQQESDIPRFFPTTTSEVMNTKSNVNSSTSSQYMHPVSEAKERGNVVNNGINYGIIGTRRINVQRNNSLGAGIKANFENNRKRLSRLVRAASLELDTQSSMGTRINHQDTGSVHSPLGTANTTGTTGLQIAPSYLNFHKNEVFATSLPKFFLSVQLYFVAEETLSTS